MSCNDNPQDLEIFQGKTFSRVIRWEAHPYVYKAISAITKTAPVNITATAHGVPDGWRVAIVSVRGMTEINAQNSPPRLTDYFRATYVDANTIQLNDVNAADYSTYTSGGYVQYLTPVSITGYTARMKIKNRVGGTVLETLTTENGKIALDATNKTITLTLSATDTAAYTFKKGVYDLEMVSGGGVVTAILSGNITVVPEVTT